MLFVKGCHDISVKMFTIPKFRCVTDPALLSSDFIWSQDSLHLFSYNISVSIVVSACLGYAEQVGQSADHSDSDGEEKQGSNSANATLSLDAIIHIKMDAEVRLFTSILVTVGKNFHSYELEI